MLNGRAVVRGRITGVERVAQEMATRLCALRPDVYRVVAPHGESRAATQIWEQAALPLTAARLRAPLIYSPANLAPVLWPRNVLVLHDASVWRSGDSFSRAYTTLHRVLEAAAAKRALRVITVSEFSRGELIDVLGLDPERVLVLPNGVSDGFHTGIDPEPVRRRYGLDRPYVLTVATGQGRKNVPLLGPLSERLANEGIDVVWAGGDPADAAIAGGSVRVLGRVPDADLPALYTGASVFLLPSSYEGFGITCIEAMRCGTVVVAADSSSLPEVCGDAALLIDPFDADAMTETVLTAVTDESQRERLRQLGFRRSELFEWDRIAVRTDEVLRGLAGIA